ncbi:hypothetical protein EMPS_04681 [Entomortierella parvispora]|uniref:Tc1-like transposase DDE domain-containing protein n=1 Tax=Entomortierella parvispora TaxID=205924 RepID=A0A9P3LVT0_9FUNG|nr:hypothetical protein EMPS_04681 [Entomortierella parvispora]
MHKPTKRYQNPFTSNEIIGIINLCNFINDQILEDPRRKLPKSREWLRKALGIGTHQAREIVRYWKSGERPPASIRTTSGWTKKLDPTFLEIVRAHIQEQNRAGKHVSLQTIVTYLSSLDPPILMSRSTLDRRFRALGLCFGSDKRRHRDYSSPQNVQCRLTYSKERLENISRLDHSPSPNVPEVFLGESYYGKGLNTNLGWYFPKETVPQNEKVPVMAMLGAFIVYDNGGRLQAEIIKSCLYIWQIDESSRLSSSAGNVNEEREETKASKVAQDLQKTKAVENVQKRKRGRPAKNTQAVEEIQEVEAEPMQRRKRGRPRKSPHTPSEVGDLPDTTNYHGDFNAELFEKFFERLCETLQETYRTGCIIHMDESKYHTREENLKPKPNNMTRKPELLAWVKENGIDVPPSKGKSHTVKEIMDYLEGLDWPAVTVCSRIAKEYGHRIMITPPYHSEVQPIESVWTLAKKPMASHPATETSPQKLKDQLWLHLSSISQKQLITLWKDALHACKAHLLGAPAEDWKYSLEREGEDEEEEGEEDEDEEDEDEEDEDEESEEE